MENTELLKDRKNRTNSVDVIRNSVGSDCQSLDQNTIMSSINLEKTSLTTVQRSRLFAYREALQNFLSIVTSCRTPNGKLKILKNTSGGSFTLTSSSKRLFQNLSVKKPVIQLLVTSAQGHLDTLSDGGLFITAFAADLVLKSMSSSRNTKLLAEVYETLLTLCLDHLSSPNCAFKYKAKMSDVNFMKSFVKSILGTKPLCEWNKENLEHISKLVLETFLQSLSVENPTLHACENVYTVTSIGCDVLQSKTLSGLLLPAPDYSKFSIQDLKPKFLQMNGNQCVKVALVTVSLSGDLDEFSNLNYEVSQGFDIDTIILEELFGFCDSLVQLEVGLVLCQKVVHPQLKLSLRQSGVIVIDRIGLQPVKYVAKLTGCVPIQNLDTRTSETSFGYLDELQHEVINRKSYVHLTRADNPVSTLMLQHHHEEPLYELKDVCETSLDSLQQLLYHPTVLAGGGCWQMGLASYLREKVTAEKDRLSVDLECTGSLVEEAASLFTQALTTAALGNSQRYSTSRITGHVFKNDGCYGNHLDVSRHCSCGIDSVKDEAELVQCIDSQEKNSDSEKLGSHHAALDDVLNKHAVVLDSFSMCLSALQTSVLTACSVLKIGQVVENL